MSQEIKYISLSTLTEQIRHAIERYSGGKQWVVAEVSSIQVNSSGHCYIELIERNENSETSRAVCQAVIWRNNYGKLSSFFQSITGQNIKQGMKLLINCSASFHSVYGLSLVIEAIEPSFTVGEVERVKQLTIQQLKSDGVFEMNRELTFPTIIQTIAVITSATAAGYGDFRDELERSPYNFNVELFQATMQGDGAESSIIAAMEQIMEKSFDAVIIIRGGGSASDLSCFDSYLLGSNIAQFPLPIITGIGHERDLSVADMVAAISLKTPTAVASYLITRIDDFIVRIEKAEQYIVKESQQELNNQSRFVENLTLQLQNLVREKIFIHRATLREIEQKLENSSREIINGHSEKNLRILRWMSVRTEISLTHERDRIARIEDKIGASGATFFERKRHYLDILNVSVEACNPRRILKLGYAIVGKGIRSVNQVKIGELLNVEVEDGKLIVKVEDKCQTKS